MKLETQIVWPWLGFVSFFSLFSGGLWISLVRGLVGVCSFLYLVMWTRSRATTPPSGRIFQVLGFFQSLTLQVVLAFCLKKSKWGVRQDHKFRYSRSTCSMQRVGRIQDGKHHECPYVTTFVSRIISLGNFMRELSLEMMLIFDSNTISCRASEPTSKVPWNHPRKSHRITLFGDADPHNIIVGCWELTLNLNLPAQLFEYPPKICWRPDNESWTLSNVVCFNELHKFILFYLDLATIQPWAIERFERERVWERRWVFVLRAGLDSHRTSRSDVKVREPNQAEPTYWYKSDHLDSELCIDLPQEKRRPSHYLRPPASTI